ncbi:MAG: hypothetical protein U0800_01745 [Isosphaeraceae bacterium]
MGTKLRAMLVIALALPSLGCPKGPEDGRPRGGGHGGDGGNYRSADTIIEPPSKLDGTKDLDRFRPRAR